MTVDKSMPPRKSTSVRSALKQTASYNYIVKIAVEELASIKSLFCPPNSNISIAKRGILENLIIISFIGQFHVRIYLAIKNRITTRTRKPKNPLARLLSAWSMSLKSPEP